MANLKLPYPLRQPSKLERLQNLARLDRSRGRGNVIHTVQRWLLYVSLFVAGFVVAKLQSLLVLAS
ncbi:MAG: hypothetical protein COU69_02985 [Candidatus Pacebacteria bacterium CG10_big_fil_rev_8_21_14_0_10_56_10]|nr:MAG: hypothetical protein COU69_02985 [Candidatus Pacebacteria bacterium CG10_big_fil_rev_8_21_14_0_10_56_10]